MNVLPDPLHFTARALERLGALVELEGGAGAAVLPEPLAERLGLPDEITFGPDETSVECGLGSPLLEALVEDVRAATPASSASLALLPPREASVRALAAQFVVRNGVAAVADASVAPATYLVAAVAWSVQADERYEGLRIGALHPRDGGRPGVALHLDPGIADAPRVEPPAFDVEVAAAWVRRLAPALVDDAVVAPLATTARRHRREHERLEGYYGDLLAEARRPKRRVDPASIEAKVAHLVAERDHRLADLVHRYGAQVDVRLAGLLWLTVPVGSATLRVRRRKGERELRLRLPAGSRVFDQLPCDGCAQWVDGGVALCDDQLHVLCARCVPEAAGRPSCPACTAARGR